MKQVLKTVEVQKTVYMACDGREFNTPAECLTHESELAKRGLKETLDQYEFKDLRCISPLDIVDQYKDDNHTYTWYLLPNPDAYMVWHEYFGLRMDIEAYPMLVCVEENSYDDCWHIGLPELIDHASYFFEKAGYKMTLTKMGEER